MKMKFGSTTGSLLAVALLAASVSSCTLSNMIKKAKNQQLTVTPNPLELHGDSVAYSLSARVPKGVVKKNKNYSLQSNYKYGDQSTALPTLTLSSKDYPNFKKEEITLNQKYGFRYEGSQMDRGELVLTGVAGNLNGKQKKTEPISVAKGILTTSQMVADVALPVYEASGYSTAEEFDALKSEFKFDQGKSVLKKNQIRGKQGKFMDQFVASKNVTQTVTITGSHSPEGREAKNVQLSEDRAKVVAKFYQGQIKKYAYGKKKGKKAAADAPEINFVTKSLIEDWRPFLDSLNASPDFTDEEKSSIAQLINSSTKGFLDTELDLQQHPAYGRIFNNIYPKLRFAETEVLVRKEKKDSATIVLMAHDIAAGTADAGTLTDKELGYAATLTQDLDEREKILLASARKNDLWSSHNNLGALYIEKAQRATGEQQNQLLTQALTQVEIAQNKNPNVKSLLNKASIQMLRKDYPGAEATLMEVEKMELSDQDRQILNGIRSTSQIKRARYDDAINNLNSSVNNYLTSYNLGLAYLLKKDFQSAVGQLQEATSQNPNFAQAHYLLAVAHARMKNMEGLQQSLANAAQLSPDMKRKAIADMEFDLVKDSEQFKNAVR